MPARHHIGRKVRRNIWKDGMAEGARLRRKSKAKRMAKLEAKAATKAK